MSGLAAADLRPFGDAVAAMVRAGHGVVAVAPRPDGAALWASDRPIDAITALRCAHALLSLACRGLEDCPCPADHAPLLQAVRVLQAQAELILLEPALS